MADQKQVIVIERRLEAWQPVISMEPLRASRWKAGGVDCGASQVDAGVLRAMASVWFDVDAAPSSWTLEREHLVAMHSEFHGGCVYEWGEGV